MNHRLIRVLAALGLTLIFSVSAVSLARAWTASSLTLLQIDEDLFYNYDFTSQTVDPTNTDWPVTMLFYNNANVDGVKNIYWGPTLFGNTMYDFMTDDGVTWDWAGDTGTKDGNCMTQFNHMRLYALNGSMYNLDWGYWVVGTTHYDRNECTPGATFGWSEEAEGTMVQRARDRGYFVFQDWASFFNPEPDRWEQNHFWQNDGNASAVYIP